MKRYEFEKELENLTVEELREKYREIRKDFETLEESFNQTREGLEPRMKLLTIRRMVSKKMGSKFLIRGEL